MSVERYTLNLTADAETRAAFYASTGLTDFFTVSNDTLTSKNDTTGYVRFAIGNLNSKNCISSFVYNYSSDIYSYVPNGINPSTDITLTKITGETTTCFCIEQTNIRRTFFTIAFDTSTINIDNNDSVNMVCCQMIPQADVVGNTSSTLLAYDMDVSTAYEIESGTTYYFNSENTSYSTKYILKPLIRRGYKSGIYTVDGGARLSLQSRILVDGHEFYILGQGLAVKVQ